MLFKSLYYILVSSVKGSGLDTARVGSAGDILYFFTFRLLQVSASSLDNIEEDLAGLENLHVGLYYKCTYLF